MKKICLFILPLLLLFAHSSQAIDQVNKKLVGSWQLVSWTEHLADGTLKHTMGENPTGLLIYDTAGNMSVQIMDSFRPNFEAGYAATTLPELKEIYNGYLAYFGKYSIDEKQQTVTHHVKGITNPTFSGADLRRYYNLTGDKLVLSVGKERTNNLVWMRIKG